MGEGLAAAVLETEGHADNPRDTRTPIWAGILFFFFFSEKLE